EPVDETLARGPIRREVTRVVTPGTLVEDGTSNVTKRHPPHAAPDAEARAVRQPRHFVLKQFEAWLNETGLAFVAVEDVRRTTPSDFIASSHPPAPAPSRANRSAAPAASRRSRSLPAASSPPGPGTSDST